jgi:predicted nucleic acid-binding protein
MMGIGMAPWKKSIKPVSWNDGHRFLIWGRHDFSHRHTDICSAHMRRLAKLAHRFVQYTGQIAISTVTLAELYAGAYKHSQTNRLLALIADLLQEVTVVDLDAACAKTFGQVRGTLLQ